MLLTQCPNCGDLVEGAPDYLWCPTCEFGWDPIDAADFDDDYPDYDPDLDFGRDPQRPQWKVVVVYQTVKGKRRTSEIFVFAPTEQDAKATALNFHVNKYPREKQAWAESATRL